MFSFNKIFVKLADYHNRYKVSNVFNADHIGPSLLIELPLNAETFSLRLKLGKCCQDDLHCWSD